MSIIKGGDGKIQYVPKDDKFKTELTDVHNDASFAICDAIDQLKQVQFDTSQQATNSNVVLQTENPNPNSTVTITFPSTSGTLGLAGASGNSFETIHADAGTDPVAATAHDTLNLTSANPALTTTGDSSTDTITFDLATGVPNGLATLDGGGKVPLSQLPAALLLFKGTWAASTNTPTLVNGTGTAGWVYISSDSGTVNFGAGPISFVAGDWVIYDGSIWEKVVNSNTVISVNGFTGIVTLDTGDISEGSNLYYTDARARNAISATAPVDYDSSTGVISMHVADATHDGYLSSADFNAFSSADPNNWKLAGNAGTTPGTDFLGTTDAQDVVLKTNSTEMVRFTDSDKLVDITGTLSTTYSVTDNGIAGLEFSTTSHTTVDGSNTTIGINGNATALVDIGAENDKSLIGINAVVTRGDGTDEGLLDAITGTTNLVFHNSGPGGTTGLGVGYLLLTFLTGGTITDYYDFKSQTVPSGSGSITNHYGIHISPDPFVTIKNWLSGFTRFGGSSFVDPTEVLDVLGSIKTNAFLKLQDPAGSNIISVQAPALAADYTLTLPVNDGSPDEVLKTDGSGNLSWTPALTNALTDSHILVGNASNMAVDVPMSGDVTIDNTGATTIATGAVDLTTDVSNVLPIANGGTNAFTKSGAFDSLSPMTTAGDIIIGGVSGTGTRLGIGTSGQVLTTVTGAPAWAANTATNANDSTFYVFNNADNTKHLNFDLGSETTGKTVTLKPLNTQNQTLQVQPNVDATANILTQNTTSGQVFIGANATIGGANSGIQYSDATTANRAQIKLHSYVNAASVAGVSTLTSKSGTVGTNSSIASGQDYSKWTAQAAATTPGSAPISGTFAFKANSINSLTVPSDFHIALTNLAGTLGDRLYLNSEGALQLPGYTAGVAHLDSSGNVTSSAVVNADIAAATIDLTTKVTGLLPIANGGTNGSTATTGFNNLSPNTTKGDLIVHNGTNNVRQAVGTDTFILTADSTASTGVKWAAAGSSGITALTGDVSASGSGSVAATVNSVGGSSAANINSAELLANASTPFNTNNAIVKRDGSGNFAAGTITATLSGNATNVSGTVAVANGGTGATTLTNRGVLLGQGTSAVVATAVGATGTVLHGNTGADPSFGAVSLTADVSGTLPIANGGTNATTKAAAFDSLSPMTTSGDIIYGGASGTGTRLAKGTNGQVLTLAAGIPSWATSSGGSFVSQDSSTGSGQAPSGTTAQRSAGVNGEFRYNSDQNTFEIYNNGQWFPLDLTKSTNSSTFSYTGAATSFSVPSGVTKLAVVVVGGGGGGGGALATRAGGGGGGGGVAYNTAYPVIPGSSISLYVGNGGTGSDNTGTGATTGETSNFGSLIGARGSSGASTAQAAVATGNGGGGSSGPGNTSGAAAGQAGLGNVTAVMSSFGYFAAGNGATAVGGGGGGASGAGVSGVASTSGGNGGTGITTSISGSSLSYGGGGGGGNNSGTAGTGGTGGGGAGGNNAVGSNGTAGSGGGGGGGANGNAGGNGGTGFIGVYWYV